MAHGNAAADAFAAGRDVEHALDDDVLQPIYDALTPAYTDSARLTYTAIVDIKAEIDEATLETWEIRAGRWVARTAARRIKKIKKTNADLIRAVLSSAIDEGLSIPKAARRLRDRWPDLSRVRSNRIAQTEILGASNAGSIEGARETGLDPRKRWLHTSDGRTRDSHERAGALPSVPIDKPFEFDGLNGPVSMDYPGDPAGPVEEVVNCRCTIIYETE